MRGLRQITLIQLRLVLGLNQAPSDEGIKTHQILVYLTTICLNQAPSDEGIKTLVLGLGVCVICLNQAPSDEGIKTDAMSIERLPFNV